MSSSHNQIDPIDNIFNIFKEKNRRTSRKQKDYTLVNVKRKKNNEDKIINSYKRGLIKLVVSTLKKDSKKNKNKVKARKTFEKLKEISNEE
jgi:hypothetical protein